MRANRYQITLIFLGLIVASLLGVFLYREIFPEYKIYQNIYWELEKFRSTTTHEPPPAFEFGVKQILIERENHGEPIIDRCVSCHVALQFSHFSPTRIARDINGNPILNENGIPQQEKNPDYIWDHLDEKMESLKKVQVGDQVYDVTKVLRAHPLMGRETRPFEYHPIDDYGCTSCHGGNDRGLTTPKAHGPVFDGQYEEEFMGPEPEFYEIDEENDPKFSKVFNHKPGHALLFQTTPILVGTLIQSKCVQCHQTSQGVLNKAIQDTEFVADQRKNKSKAIKKAYEDEKLALEALEEIQKSLSQNGYEKTVNSIRAKSNDYTLPSSVQKAYKNQLNFLLNEKEQQKTLQNTIDQTKKSLTTKAAAVAKDEESMAYIKASEKSFTETATNHDLLKAVSSEIDLLISGLKRGQELYISQACYACHRIAGFARGGVGPELTMEGLAYPWFIKESIVWPQADLKTSTMPNYNLDHEELEDLVAFLLAQRGRPKDVSEKTYKTAIALWEGGKRLPWEEPIPSDKLHDLRYSMTLFATEGCAACHRLKGFDSNVGYRAVKEKDDFEVRFKESNWFNRLFPEDLAGSEIVKILETKSNEIDQHIVDNVREGALIEEIEQKYPGVISSYYTNFKFASRAKKDTEWKERVHRVLMVYIQEYGLGRIVGPRPNWSGIYRSNEWLIEHFRKPSRHIARSIMPVFPFDDTKFYALTYMLDQLGIRNRNQVREIWDKLGFDPALAYKIHCSQCHGEYLHGDGPVSRWIYPIPKNLRNADFLRNFTKENVISSIKHGVKGTPMPPWGEVAHEGSPVLTESEIKLLTDWIFSSLLGGEVIRGYEDVPKWQYSPKDALDELEKEKNTLKSGPTPEFFELREAKPDVSLTMPKEPGRQLSVDSVFNSKNNMYFIKSKYFTEENIKQGQAFFELNCAVCHGIEADGTGYRAGTMFDAKPRMLTNLHWVDTHDDLRLLRSIKYGVPGTSMIPWGDQTSSLQRLQLVIFIRSLSQTQLKRDELFNTLYSAFDNGDQQIEEARIKVSAEKDEQLRELKKLLKEESQIYQILGVQLISESLEENAFNHFLDSIRKNAGRYSFKEGKLTSKFAPEKEVEESEKAVLDILQKKESSKNLEKLKNDMISGFSEAKRLREKQQKIIKAYAE